MEQIISIFLWVFTVLGITTIVTQSTLLLPFRMKIQTINSWLGTLFSCNLCFSFWASLLVSLFLGSISGNLFFDGCIGTGVLWFITLRTQ